MPRLIDAKPLMENGWHLVQTGESNRFLRSMSLADIPTVDAVVLPCNVGDTVYIVGDKFPAEIEEIRIKKDGVFFVYAEYDRGYELTELWDDGEFHAADIGKTVFLTDEEAEAALAKMDGDGND